MAVLITDENGKIKGIAKLPMNNIKLPLAENAADIIKTESGTLGRVGTKGSALSLADHVHPYSTEWTKDKAWIEFVNKKLAVEEWVNQRMTEEYNKSKLEVWKVLADAMADVAIGLSKISKDVLPELAKLLVLLFEGLIGFGVHIIKDKAGNEHDIGKLKEDLENRQ